MNRLRRYNPLRTQLNRRQMLGTLAGAAGAALFSGCGGGGSPSGGGGGGGGSNWPPSLPVGTWNPSASVTSFLESLLQKACLYFWEQASPTNGQVLDHAENFSSGGLDTSTAQTSIAATGFGLGALCIADQRGYQSHSDILARVQATLNFYLNGMPNENGFFYHFNDINTGLPLSGVEVSAIDTAILMCGVLTARAYFNDPTVTSLATQLYERVNWPWMLNGGSTFAMAWYPAGDANQGFTSYRFDTYCELMMLYLLAIGSPTYPIAASYWNNFSRPVLNYEGYSYFSNNDDPLFVHQYSHAFFDFRKKADAYGNYFNNSIAATQAHITFCLAYPNTSSPYYNMNYWGISASDSINGYEVWGGPPAFGPIDGSVVPCAPMGALPFLPNQSLQVLQAMYTSYNSSAAWGRYGYFDAFHPAANWYCPQVLGIDQGISALMIENQLTGSIWKTFMQNPECTQAMQAVGFTTQS
jgi:hypothetical protein